MQTDLNFIITHLPDVVDIIRTCPAVWRIIGTELVGLIFYSMPTALNHISTPLSDIAWLMKHRYKGSARTRRVIVTLFASGNEFGKEDTDLHRYSDKK
ncbi:MAG: hypothetical protein RR954_08255 [Christensenellaceae bacterium]